MNIFSSEITGAGLFFLFIFLSGFWLSRSGKPYGTLIFTVHKFIALAAIVFLISIVYRQGQAAALDSLEISAIVVSAVIFVAIIAAGGLLSIAAAGSVKGMSQSVQTASLMAHRILPYLATLSSAVSLYLLLFRK